jgi:hypothetical protein
MIGNSTYSKVAANQTMRLQKADNHYSDICHPENLEPIATKKLIFLFK